MSSSAANWKGTAVVALGALGFTLVGFAGFDSVRVPSDDATTAAAPLDPTTEIRVRALADAATLGVSGIGCNEPLRGSGFVVDDTSYTNRHLVEGGEMVKFDQLIDPIVLPVDGRSSVIDLATADAVDAIALEFADRNPEIGATVFVAGHAGGGDTQVVRGLVHLYGAGEVWGVGGNVMLIDAITEPGFSGGPVLDTNGQVVAMLQGFEPTIGLTLAIPVEDLRSWSTLDQEATPARCQQ